MDYRELCDLVDTALKTYNNRSFIFLYLEYIARFLGKFPKILRTKCCTKGMSQRKIYC